jgi:quinol monooxygenase YgiN
VFIEEWQSDEALRAHFATSHIAEFMWAVPATIVAPADVKFPIASSRKLAEITRD